MCKDEPARHLGDDAAPCDLPPHHAPLSGTRREVAYSEELLLRVQALRNAAFAGGAGGVTSSPLRRSPFRRLAARPAVIRTGYLGDEGAAAPLAAPGDETTARLRSLARSPPWPALRASAPILERYSPVHLTHLSRPRAAGPAVLTGRAVAAPRLRASPGHAPKL